LEVSRQGFYSYLRRGKSQLAIEKEVLSEKIKESYENSKGLYGSPRIAEELNKRGMFTSKNRVARLMQKMKYG
jgi:putative transposase